VINADSAGQKLGFSEREETTECAGRLCSGSEALGRGRCDTEFGVYRLKRFLDRADITVNKSDGR